MSKTLNTARSPELKKALMANPVYGDAFTTQVKSLAHVIGDALSAEVEHEEDMNYSSGQRIVVWLSEPCRVVAPYDAQAKYRLVDIVSSRGPFFALVILKLSATTDLNAHREQPERIWESVGEESLPANVKRLRQRVAALMQTKGYKLLEEPLLSQQVQGRVTELDGKPATVFEVLFSELY